MKKIFYTVFLFPALMWAQLDFESYKGKLDFVKLPEIESVSQSPLLSSHNFLQSQKRLPSFQLNRENYREPVPMLEALIASENPVRSSIQINLDPRAYGIYTRSHKDSPDKSTRVQNRVYEDASRNTFYRDPYWWNYRHYPYRTGYPYYSPYRGRILYY